MGIFLSRFLPPVFPLELSAPLTVVTMDGLTFFSPLVKILDKLFLGWAFVLATLNVACRNVVISYWRKMEATVVPIVKKKKDCDKNIGNSFQCEEKRKIKKKLTRLGTRSSFSLFFFFFLPLDYFPHVTGRELMLNSWRSLYMFCCLQDRLATTFRVGQKIK